MENSNNTCKNHLGSEKAGITREDYMKIEIPGFSRNEAFARATVAAFAARLDPTIEEISDIKTAVSEAVTNAIIHGYENEIGIVNLCASVVDRRLEIEIADRGKGIDDIEKVKEPFFTTRPDMERSGMGFTIMESFMDELQVYSNPGEGTTIRMVKIISTKKNSITNPVDVPECLPGNGDRGEE